MSFLLTECYLPGVFGQNIENVYTYMYAYVYWDYQVYTSIHGNYPFAHPTYCLYYRTILEYLHALQQIDKNASNCSRGATFRTPFVLQH